jgi:endo-1,4-beta-xylanase
VAVIILGLAGNTGLRVSPTLEVRVRTALLRICTLTVVLGSAGCLPEEPGTTGTGGSPGASGGTGATQQGGTGPAASGGTNATGGAASPSTGGRATGGNPTGGTATGGTATGGKATGGTATGGTATGGTATGGKATGGTATGGKASGGSATGGKATGGTSTGGTGTVVVNKFVGNITTGNSVNPSGLTYYKYWDQITPENAGKWGSVQSTPSSGFNWATLDSIYNYTQTNKITFKQHCFVWGSQQPNGTPTLAQVENWIKSFCQRYPNTKLIDVVNEPPPHTTPNYTSNLGAGESGTYGWITKAFKLARQYCGGAILILNDYNNIEWSGNQDNFVNIVNQVKSAGGPIDAVGAQAHDLDYNGMSLSTVSSLLASLNSRTGLPVYITEMDLSYADDTQQLTAYKQYFQLFMDASYVKGITIWGWIYGSTWSQAPDSGLVRGTSPRPAMTWLMGQLGRPVPPN